MTDAGARLPALAASSIPTVTVDRMVEVDRLATAVGEDVTFDGVLMLTDEGRALHDNVSVRMMTPPPGLAALPAADQRALRELLRVPLQ